MLGNPVLTAGAIAAALTAIVGFLVLMGRGLYALHLLVQKAEALAELPERTDEALSRMGREISDVRYEMDDRLQIVEGAIEPLSGLPEKIDEFQRFLRTRDAAYGMNFDALDRRLESMENAINGNGAH